MKITIYTKPNCHLCKRLERMLKEFNLEFTTVVDNPLRDELYPIICLNDDEFSLEEICLKLFEGEIGT